MQLRGFDSYDVSLGDQMRGERASLGKSLADAERDMRIKARIITAIEDCDVDGFPNQSVIAGYVRSYARYLGLDVDETFQRFCSEAGYQSPGLHRPGNLGEKAGRQTHAHVGRLGPSSLGVDPIGRSRFAPTKTQGSFRPRVSLGALTSAVALVGLICTLSYGGYALLQDIQRVGFAPLPQAPSVVVDAPAIDTPNVDMASLPRPAAEDYAGGGTLAEVVLPGELSAASRSGRDGPISAIDPADAGLFTSPEPEPETFELVEGFDPADDPTVRVEQKIQTGSVFVAQLDNGVVLRASEDAWIRVRGGDNSVVFEGTLVAGDSFGVPDRVAAPTLRSGNAGGIYVVVDGIAYGPVGERGRIASDISLRADDVRTNMRQAEPEELQPAEVTGVQRRAEVTSAARQ
ncbi:MAG: helix-turn-helix domain-containing protein [Paracoccaceae bacterium]